MVERTRYSRMIKILFIASSLTIIYANCLFAGSVYMGPPNPDFHDLELWASSMIEDPPKVVEVGEIKSSNHELYTFFVNACTALIIDTREQFYMAHVYPVGDPSFESNINALKEFLTLDGDIYVISNNPLSLSNFLPRNRIIYIYDKPDNSVATVKATKLNGEKVSIKAEFHPNIFLNNMDKLIVMSPWGSLKPIYFKMIMLKQYTTTRTGISEVKIEAKFIEENRKQLEDRKPELQTANRYNANTNGVVRDTKTVLEWVTGPDRNMTWYQAKKWVDSLNIGGGGWRMPTVDELKTLYNEGAGNRNITPLLKTTGWFVWAVEKDSSSPWLFYFGYGVWKHWYPHGIADFNRAFAVRSQSDG